MRKEVVFAVATGIIFGLVIAFGILRANKAIKDSGTGTSTTDQQVYEVTPTPETSTSLISLTKPGDEEISSESPTEVLGITRANTWVVVVSDTEDLIVASDQKGEFKADINLSPSLNLLTITAVDDSGNTIEKRLRLVYSTEFAKESLSEKVATNAAVEEKVNQKVESVLNKATFYTGTITDITKDSFQIKTDSGEIKQVSVNADSTSFIKIGKTQSKIKLSEVAIGDYIISLGYIKDKDVLSSSRVLITSPYQSSERKVLLAKVTTIKKDSITVNSISDNKEYQITPSDKISVTEGPNDNMKKIKFSNINEGDIILISGTIKETSIEAKRINITSSAEPSPTPSPTIKPPKITPTPTKNP